MLVSSFSVITSLFSLYFFGQWHVRLFICAKIISLIALIQGDSGGPFVCRESADAAWTLIGVTSWAYPPCGADFYPSVYSRTAYFRDWISDNCGGCI